MNEKRNDKQDHEIEGINDEYNKIMTSHIEYQLCGNYPLGGRRHKLGDATTKVLKGMYDGSLNSSTLQMRAKYKSFSSRNLILREFKVRVENGR